MAQKYIPLSGGPPGMKARDSRFYPGASAFFTVAGEHCITRAMCRSPAPSWIMRRHCSTPLSLRDQDEETQTPSSPHRNSAPSSLTGFTRSGPGWPET